MLLACQTEPQAAFGCHRVKFAELLAKSGDEVAETAFKNYDSNKNTKHSLIGGPQQCGPRFTALPVEDMTAGAIKTVDGPVLPAIWPFNAMQARRVRGCASSVHLAKSYSADHIKKNGMDRA
jgi:hypothetical protein